MRLSANVNKFLNCCLSIKVMSDGQIRHIQSVRQRRIGNQDGP